MAYDYDKILVESAVRHGAGVPVTILRLPKVYGPGDPQQRLRPYVRRMLEGAAEIRLDRAKAAWRWTRGAVEEVADAIALAVTAEKASGRVYNLGEERASSEADWVRAIGEAAGWTGRVPTSRPRSSPKRNASRTTSRTISSPTPSHPAVARFRERIGRAESLRRAVSAERSRS